MQKLMSYIHRTLAPCVLHAVFDVRAQQAHLSNLIIGKRQQYPFEAACMAIALLRVPTGLRCCSVHLSLPHVAIATRSDVNIMDH